MPTGFTAYLAVIVVITSIIFILGAINLKNENEYPDICLICGDDIGPKRYSKNCQCMGARCNICKQIYQGLAGDCLCTSAVYPLQHKLEKAA